MVASVHPFVSGELEKSLKIFIPTSPSPQKKNRIDPLFWKKKQRGGVSNSLIMPCTGRFLACLKLVQTCICPVHATCYVQFWFATSHEPCLKCFDPNQLYHCGGSAPFFKTVPKRHCFGSIFFLSALIFPVTILRVQCEQAYSKSKSPAESGHQTNHDDCKFILQSLMSEIRK